MDFKTFYILNSRILTHLCFWVIYYISFSLIWASNQSYFESFFLEFVLLPTRILAVYTTIYLLLPNYLLQRKYSKFLLGYAIIIIMASILQRLFIHFFYESLLLDTSSNGIFSLRMLVRAGVLINTTVFLVLSFKIFQLYLIEKNKTEKLSASIIEIKADRRIYRVNVGNILFIEGQGNYTTYHIRDGSKITAYGSIKKTLEQLPEYFVRVHKSFVINKREIKSFDANSVEIQNQLIPRGKSVDDSILLI